MFKFLGNDFIEMCGDLGFYFDDYYIKDISLNVKKSMIICVSCYYDLDEQERRYRVDFNNFGYAYITESCYYRLLKYLKAEVLYG